ncbi:peptide ABC transporter substrate-binding protein [Leuconostoc falkenbergense]|uniref:peptide ABC transporter substrate-binding protein n=1 Tax=Leuconostoc falkenbergense TaxID=2766470 RepID=UPI0021A9BE33|nr:peptide ABC transporter substrate-binding protein [Leuconostoc falkenbergense]MCT4389442.1 peptide ABC transporter substrate-binding protein [Leuconostoc falkenbergense]
MKKRTGVIVGVLGVAVVAGFMYFPGQHNKNSKSQTLQTMMKDDVITMSPIMLTDIYSAQAQTQVYEGLYRYKGNRVVTGNAVKVVKPTQNGTVYTFKIRDNAKWSNGDKVTAQDFVTAIQAIADPKTKSQNSADAISIIKNYDDVHDGKISPNKIGAVALDAHTLRITLTQATPAFDKLATSIIPVNTKDYKKWGTKYGTSSKYMVTNGAYQMTGWTGTNSSFTFTKNAKYWDAQQVKIEKVKVRVIKTPMTAANEFKNKHLDIAQISDDYIKTYKNTKYYHATPQAVVRGIYFNETSNKTNNLHLRQAFGYLIDRNTITSNIMNDGSMPQSNAVPKGVMSNPTTGTDFTTDAGTQFKVNKEKAKEEWKAYLKEVGKTSETFNMTFDDDSTSKKVGAYIQYAAEHEFKGITINTKYEPHAQLVSEVLKQDFDMANVGLSVSVPDAAYPLAIGKSGYGLNFSKVNDTDNDAYLDKAAKEANNPKERYQTLQTANKYFTKTKAYMVPIYQPVTANAVTDKVGGFQGNSFHSPAYQDMYWK